MKKLSILIVLLIVGLVTASMVFATSASKGETWAIEYTIQWTDTYETVTQGILYYTQQTAGSTNLENYARRQLGWSTNTKNVSGRRQQLFLNCILVSRE